MNKTISRVIAMIMAVTLFCSCHASPRSGVTQIDQPAPEPAPVEIEASRQVMIMPRAVVYKTNGDYDDNVMVTLTQNRRSLVSFPAPGDVGSFSNPVKLSDGWLLDRRGSIGRNTAFLTWTYENYSKLETPPSPDQLMKSVIGQARVTSFVTLPMTPDEALADTARCNKLISVGFPGCIMVSLEVESPML